MKRCWRGVASPEGRGLAGFPSLRPAGSPPRPPARSSLLSVFSPLLQKLILLLIHPSAFLFHAETLNRTFCRSDFGSSVNEL